MSTQPNIKGEIPKERELLRRQLIGESRRRAWVRWREAHKAKPAKRKCETCECQFVPRLDTQKYCSRKCSYASPEVRRRKGEASKLRWADPEYKKQMASRRPAWSEWARKAELATDKRKCENCATNFVPKMKRGSNAQKYCSERCRDTAYARRKRAKPEYRAKIRERWEHDPKFRETRLASERRWRERNPEKAKAATRRWCAKNLKHLAEYARIRRRANPEKSREYQRDQYHRLREAARRKTPGAKRNPIYAEANRLRQNNPSLSLAQIARKLLPNEYRIDADRTVDKLKKGIKYLRKSEKLKP